MTSSSVERKKTPHKKLKYVRRAAPSPRPKRSSHEAGVIPKKSLRAVKGTTKREVFCRGVFVVSVISALFVMGFTLFHRQTEQQKGDRGRTQAGPEDAKEIEAAIKGLSSRYYKTREEQERTGSINRPQPVLHKRERQSATSPQLVLHDGKLGTADTDLSSSEEGGPLEDLNLGNRRGYLVGTVAAAMVVGFLVGLIVFCLPLLIARIVAASFLKMFFTFTPFVFAFSKKSIILSVLAPSSSSLLSFCFNSTISFFISLVFLFIRLESPEKI